MAVLDFPASPTTGDLYTGDNGAVYIYDTNRWKLLVSSPTVAQTEIVEVFTADGTWTKPAGLIYAEVEVVGGGGGGGGPAITSGSQAGAGHGGGGGGYARAVIPAADLGATETVTLGDAGTGVSGTTGNAGGTSTFTRTTGTNITATGGAGGFQSIGQQWLGANLMADGGIGAGGDINATGQPGERGYHAGTSAQSSPVGMGGGGGSSVLGGGGRAGGTATTGVTGSAPSGGYGGGGGGGANANNASAFLGGAGADGVIIVTSHIAVTVDGVVTANPLRQVVIATSTTDDTTQSATAVNSTLTASITPLQADSVIVVTVSARIAALYVSGGAIAARYATYEIYRSTGTPAIIQSADVGRNLVATNAAQGESYDALHLMATEAPGAGTHTYRLRHFVPNAVLRSDIRGSAGVQAVIKIEEFAP